MFELLKILFNIYEINECNNEKNPPNDFCEHKNKMFLHDLFLYLGCTSYSLRVLISSFFLWFLTKEGIK